MIKICVENGKFFHLSQPTLKAQTCQNHERKKNERTTDGNSALIFSATKHCHPNFCHHNKNIFFVDRFSEKTQEARRILLSDINFTSMVPELSRSADHLCQQKINEEENEDGDYFKGNLLKTPDYARGLTPSTSMASPGVSQWTVNESTTQTEGFWQGRGDSFDSSKSYSLQSGGNSMNVLNKHHRSRSVPSIRCAICKQNHQTMKPSESLHYATRTVTFQGKLRCFSNYQGNLQSKTVL